VRCLTVAIGVISLLLGRLTGPADAETESWQVAQLLGGASGPDSRSVADVTALSPDDAWAVGGQLRASRGVPFAEHWDGASWTEVPLPDGLPGSLDGVTASSPADVWALDGYARRLLRWNGQSWTDTTMAPHGWVGATALSPDSVWAGSSTGEGTEYLQHWDGKQWSSYAVQMSTLESLAVISDDDVWMVGRYGANATAVHWDGTALTRVPLPDIATPEGAETSLHSVTALTSNDVWAVGDYDWLPTDGQPRQYRSVALRWDGTSWTRVPTPDGQHAVSGVTPDGAGDVWMVQDTPEVAPPFAKKELLHHTGDTWTLVPVSGTPDGRGVEEVELTNVPGTTSMWGAATLTYPYSYDWRGTVLHHD
jgi:hypothetical protein